MKKCSKCKKEQPLESFNRDAANKDGHRTYCRSCQTAYTRVYNRTDSGKKSRKKYEKSGKGKSAKAKYNQKYLASGMWAVAVKSYIRSYRREYKKKRLVEDPAFRISLRIRKRISKFTNSRFKKGNTEELFGCSREKLVSHFESKFKPGMTWDNYGKWHIDHIRPLSKFNLQCREEVLKANHFLNLQPLWAIENIKKGAKI